MTVEVIIGRRDTIAAIATPVGTGGVGVIRISGPRSIEIVGQILQREPARFPDRYMVRGIAKDGDRKRLDDVLAVVMRAPRSFTGEHVAEIHGHGGVVNMARLLRAVIAAGARHAEAGEFTRRAFENGKLDLVEAEAIVEVIEASSERAWRLAQAHLDGELGTRIDEFRARATELLAIIEASIDFPEQGEQYASHRQIAREATNLSNEIKTLAQTFTVGRALRDGIEVAIIGPVNAGKSSLFNALAHVDRAIVDESPGTTRDFVELSVVWDGIPVTLIDTAGDRDTDNRVETQGIHRGRVRAAEADVRVHTRSVDADRATVPENTSNHRSADMVVMTKGDLLPGISDRTDNIKRDFEFDGYLVTSARTGIGIEALRQRIIQQVCGAAAESDDGHTVTSERHRTLLEQAAAALDQTERGVIDGEPTEILAIEVREATQRLAAVVGDEVGDEVLDALFSRFCIGK